MRCTKCNAEIDDYDINCPFCGQKTSEVYIRDVADLKRKIKENTPPIDFFKIIQDLLCDRKDESAGTTRLFFVFFAGIFSSISIVLLGIFQPSLLLDITNFLGKLFDFFWSLLGLTPDHFLARSRGYKGGDIRVLLTVIIMISIAIRYIAGKDRSGDDKKK